MTGQGNLYEWTHIDIHIMYTYRHIQTHRHRLQEENLIKDTAKLEGGSKNFLPAKPVDDIYLMISI